MTVLALTFLALSSLILLQLVVETRAAVLTNLYETCKNATAIRPPGEADSCWQEYSDLSGEPRPASAGSTDR